MHLISLNARRRELAYCGLALAASLAMAMVPIRDGTSVSCPGTGAACAQTAARSDQTMFLHFGKPLSEHTSRDRIDRLKQAEARFPTLAACLKEPQAGAMPQLDWRALRNTEDLEVCVFRIAASLGEAQAVADWLKAEGFGPTTIIEQPADRMGSYGSNRPGTAVSARWLRAERRFPFFTLPLMPFGIRSGFGAQALTVTTQLAHDGQPLHVDAQFAFK
jgi:hypothetical protein